MSIATDVRAYADLALEQGKSALSQAGAVVTNVNKRLAADAPKPVLAALGAADMVAQTLGKRVETVGKRVESLPTLPAAAAGNVAKAQESGMALLSRTQDDALSRITELRGRLDAGLESVKSLPALPVAAAQSTSGYLDNAKQAYGMLTARGEARLADLRKDPRVTRLLGDLDEASSTIQARLAPVLGSVRSEVMPHLDSAFDAIEDADLGEPAPRTRTSRRATGSRRVTAAATPARKSTRSTAGTRPKSADSTATAGKTAAKKASTATARKAPAKKASAATARKAPAKKA
jgi:hypothetical protein